MMKLVITTAAAVVALSIPAFAAPAMWNATETASSGIKRGTGAWTVNTEGDKVTGSANMQLDNGTVLTYKLDGKVEGGVYTLNMNDRSDGKKNCVWTGKPVASSNGRVIDGPVACDGEKFSVKAGLQ